MIETQPAPTYFASTKDKRLLVLFLLGLALLSGNWLSLGQETAIYSYNVVFEENGRQWRVVSTPVAAATDRESQSRTFPFPADQGIDSHLPAQLALFFNRPLPINRADQAALEMLPGIGPSLAAAISKTSQQAGLAGPADLLKVPGIGPGTMQRLAPLISFEQ